MDIIHLTESDRRTASVMAELQRKVPLGDLGFPLGIYRSDLLPWHDYEPEVDVLSRLTATSTVTPKEVIRHGNEGQSEGQEVQTQGEEPDVLTEEEQELLAEAEAFGEVDDYEAGLEVLGSDGVPETAPQRPTQALIPVHSQLPPPNSGRVAGFRRQDLNPAFVPLAFDEGFPSLPNGNPCWEQLEWEPTDAYIAFQSYLQMPNVTQGVRSLGELPEVMAENQLLTIQPTEQPTYVARFRNHYTVYNWGLRTRAYDLYKMAALRKKQEFRASSLQEEHFNIAQTLKGRLLEYLKSEDEFWDMMTPKVAIEFLKMLLGAERLAVGLPANAPLTEAKGGQPGGQSLEMILRTLVQQHVPIPLSNPGTEGQGAESQLASQILDDPEATRYAQELIIRLTTRQNQTTGAQP